MRATDHTKNPSASQPSDEDVRLAQAAQRSIMAMLDHVQAASLTLITDEGKHPPIELPLASLRILSQLLGMLSQGNNAAVVPVQRELTAMEAANLLGVSHPFVIREIEAGRLPHRQVGMRRLVTLADLQGYDRKMREQQDCALDKLAEDARRLKLDY